MPRYTLAAFKQTENWAQVLNLSVTDPRWLQLLNKALEQLMNAGPWVGTHQKYMICTRNACLTWPRQFDTIEVVDICGQPVTIRNQWFEFIEQGPGGYRGRCGSNGPGSCQNYNYLDRGRGFVMFDDTTVASYIRLYTQFASDAGKVVNIRGFDNKQQWVLTDDGATAGENMTLTGSYVDSTTVWMPQVFREVIKPLTNGHVRAYSYPADDPNRLINPGAVALTPLAIWEPSETIPNYRRCFIPQLLGGGGCCNGVVASSCKPTVMVMAHLAFIPLISDLDFLPLTNAPAISLAMQAVQKQQRGDYEGFQRLMFGTLNPVTRRYEGGAICLLDEELETYQGAGSVVPVRLEHCLETAGVPNLL